MRNATLVWMSFVLSPSTTWKEPGMKKLIAIVLMTTSMGASQITQTVVTKPTTPEQDSKPNSEEVPDGYAVEGEFERVVVLRFKYRVDLLATFDPDTRLLRW